MRRRSLLLSMFSPLLMGADGLSGRWRSVTTTKGGIGAVYEFDSRGRATYSSVALVEMDYQLEGAYLKLSGQTIGTGWHPDGRLQLNYGQNVVEDYKRVGAIVDRQAPLIGEWLGTRLMAGRVLPIRYIFQKGSKALFLTFLKTTPGSWQTAPGQGFLVRLPGLPDRNALYDSKAERMTITVDGGDPHEFSPF